MQYISMLTFTSSKLTIETIKTPERRQWCPSGIFVVNFEHISQLFLVLLCYFEQVNVSWDKT